MGMGVPKWLAKWEVRVSTVALLLSTLSATVAFTTPTNQCFRPRITALSAHEIEPTTPSSHDENQSSDSSRRSFLSSIVGPTSSAVLLIGTTHSALAAEEDATGPSSFESIAARAAKISEEVAREEAAKEAAAEDTAERKREIAQRIKDDPRTIYDFTLPVNGNAREVAELVGQTFSDGDGADGWSDGGEPGVNAAEERLGTRVKAILVVNIKQDDPIARKNVPELIALATK